MRGHSKTMWCGSQDWPFCLQPCQHCDLELPDLSSISSIFLWFKSCSIYDCLLRPRRVHTRFQLLYPNVIGASGSGWVDTHPHSLKGKDKLGSGLPATRHCQPQDPLQREVWKAVGPRCCSSRDFPLWGDPSRVWGGSARKAAETLLETSWSAR